MSSSTRTHTTAPINNSSRFPPSLSSTSSCPIHSAHFSFKQTSALLSDATKPQLNRYLRRHGRGSRANHSKADLHKRAMMLAVCQWRMGGVVLTRESFLGQTEGCGCCRDGSEGRQVDASGGEEKREDKKVGEGNVEAAARDAQEGSTMHEGEENGVDEERQNDENSSTTAVGYYSDTITEQLQASTTIASSSVSQPHTSIPKNSIEKDIVPEEGESSANNDDDYVEISFETAELCHQPTEVKVDNPEQCVANPEIKDSDETGCVKGAKLPMLREDWTEVSSNPPVVESLQTTSNNSPITTRPERNDGDIEDDYIITTFNEWAQSVEASATPDPDLAITTLEAAVQKTCHQSADVARGSLNMGICRDCKDILDTVICFDDFKDGDGVNNNGGKGYLTLLPSLQPPRDEPMTEEDTNVGDDTLDSVNFKDNMAETESRPDQIKEAPAPVVPSLTASISIDDCIYPGAFPKDSETDDDDDDDGDDIGQRT